MFQLKAKLIFNKRIKDKYWHCAFLAPLIAKNGLPGQFVDIRVNDATEPLLRRPFSIHRVSGSGIGILYEVVGPGTEILSERKSGEYLDVIGPLGNGFDLNGQRATGNGQTVLIAGGVGVAPLIFVAEKLSKLQTPNSKLITLIGAKTKNQILCEKEFKDLGCSVKIATDDGSRGFRGYVSDLVKHLLSTMDYRLSTIYACGPRPMLKEISKISKQYKIEAQISLEEHMACGIGACLGCAVNTKNGYQRVCKEGPVFKAEEVIW